MSNIMFTYQYIYTYTKCVPAPSIHQYRNKSIIRPISFIPLQLRYMRPVAPQITGNSTVKNILGEQ